MLFNFKNSKLFKDNSNEKIQVKHVFSANHKGFLVLIGGAEDKKDRKAILKSLLNINNPKNIAVIPSASSYPASLADDYRYAFRDLGIENITIFDVREKSDAERSEYLAKVNEIDLFFFTGGDQVKLVKTLHNTTLLKLIKNKFENGATIAGTSAGAAASSNPMIFDGDQQGLIKGSINHAEGFGFIQHVTIDTHFVNRGRLGRLTQFLSSGHNTRGMGIGEDTAIIISPNGIGQVIGSEMITIANTEEVTFNNYKDVNDREPIALNGIKVGFLSPGCIFDLNKWEIISCDHTIKHIVPLILSSNQLNE